MSGFAAATVAALCIAQAPGGTIDVANGSTFNLDGGTVAFSAHPTPS
jgi:hypothetical protein